MDKSMQLQEPDAKNNIHDTLLKFTAMFWFLVVMAGQWIFFIFIIAFYVYSVVSGNLDIWNRFEPFGSTPFKADDSFGNLAFATHAIGAGIVAFGGVFQLIPHIRNRFPRFHKITGYVYLITVLALSLSGFYLVWIRDASPNLQSAIGTTINGCLILAFAYLTVSYARKRDINTHRKWAMRLFLVANAQWFLRIGVMSYFIVSNTIGIPSTYFPTFMTVWTFGCYLLPLAVLQLYFRAKGPSNKCVKIVANVTLIGMTLLLGLGVVGFTPVLHKLTVGEPIVF